MKTLFKLTSNIVNKNPKIFKKIFKEDFKVELCDKSHILVETLVLSLLKTNNLIKNDITEKI